MPFIQNSDGSDGKESASNTEDPGSIPGLGEFPAEGNGYPPQYSRLENFMVGYSTWGGKESDATEQLTPSLAESTSFSFGPKFHW